MNASASPALRLGRNVPPPEHLAHDGIDKSGKKKLHFRDFVISLTTPPTSVDFSAKAMPSLNEMYLNDSEGDCVIAGGYHVVGVETGNATGSPFIATAVQINEDYGAIGGYVPGDPSTDNGCDEETALQYWIATGFKNGTKLAGRLQLDATNKLQVMQAIDLFENAFLGLCLPKSYISPFPSASGFVWDVDSPDFNNGHCVIVVGYNTQGVIISTWGMLGILTWAALAALCVASAGGQIFVMLSPDQVAKGQAKAPNGFAWADLVKLFDAMGGDVPVPPDPAPPAPPPPAPPPAPPVPPAPPPPAPPAPPSPPPGPSTLHFRRVDILEMTKLANPDVHPNRTSEFDLDATTGRGQVIHMHARRNGGPGDEIILHERE